MGIVIIFLILCIFVGCLPPPKPPPNLIKLPFKKWPVLKKPQDLDTFFVALERSLNYYQKLPPDYTFLVAGTPYTALEMEKSLKIFKYCLNKSNWQSCIRNYFDLYQAAGLNQKREVLFTGYYQPILYGSFSPNERFKYPIYRVPDELLKIDLKRFDETLPPRILIGMVRGNEVIPFYSRAEIDYSLKLAGKGYEIIWVDDPIELFFLHIQGSGIVILPDGKKVYLHYAISNGRPYKSIGQVMKTLGLLEKPNGIKIKKYFKNHPEMMKKIFSVNESYIFFQIVEKGPLGALDEILTPYYSLATDPNIFPKGSMLFLQTEIPIVDDKQNLKGWQTFHSFALSQDTGSAIKGPGRADIFFGTGNKAEAKACYMARRGKLYLLIKKK
ncbi:MAG TPA: hypothetical protein ENG63_00440 [Candidatus Desulfofervidus auxilii]|uniref:peptidoglycan lytic exotransglycosylase n=1 Tax=Desulfofervidus auxilii TaxID=1621989 RepID=A0A7C0U196_DESA2|nr:hypothetical protein [Candidatus Desulfofervidus auxilii]